MVNNDANSALISAIQNVTIADLRKAGEVFFRCLCDVERPTPDEESDDQACVQQWISECVIHVEHGTRKLLQSLYPDQAEALAWEALNSVYTDEYFKQFLADLRFTEYGRGRLGDLRYKLNTALKKAVGGIVSKSAAKRDELTVGEKADPVIRSPEPAQKPWEADGFSSAIQDEVTRARGLLVQRFLTDIVRHRTSIMKLAKANTKYEVVARECTSSITIETFGRADEAQQLTLKGLICTGKWTKGTCPVLAYELAAVAAPENIGSEAMRKAYFATFPADQR